MRKVIAIYCLELEKETESKEEMMSSEKEHKDKQKEEAKGHVLNAIDFSFYHNVSGICKFINVDKSEKSFEQERFIILSFHGIYNFEFNDSKDINFNLKEQFNYPKEL
jgi:hypothetical protein